MKIKCVGRQEFVIAGWTDPQRSRVGLGALLVGYYEGDRLRYAGKVGTGYTREVLLDLRKRFDGLGRKANPFDDGEPPLGEAVHWVEPKLVAEIAFAEWTQNGLLRQPRYEGLRPDKAAIECRRERPAPAAAVRPQQDGRSDSPGRHRHAAGGIPHRNATSRRRREPSGAEEGQGPQAADLRRAGAPRLASCTTTSAWRPTACSRAGRCPRGRRWTRRSSGWRSRSRTTRSATRPSRGRSRRASTAAARSRSGTTAPTRA